MTRLSLVLDAYFRMHDVDQKKVAATIGISQSTLTRIKHGKLPDAEGLAKLVLWLVGETMETKP